MAEIAQGSPNEKGKVRAKRMSTRIDMTPMVDLAFLLLTFFILTATFTKSNTMSLTMPDKHDPSPPPKISDKDVLNLVLAENNKLYWWIGADSPAQTTGYHNDGIRKILLDQTANNSKLMVLIKPKDDSTYENIIDILDEIAITKADRYAIVDFTAEDEHKIAPAN